MTVATQVIFDIETDGLDYTKLHCISVCARYPGVGWHVVKLFTDEKEFYLWALANTNPETKWIAHNACGFDYYAINDLTRVKVTKEQIVDTSVISKYLDYNKFRTHSLAELGEYVGVPKMEYTGGWEEYTTEMGDYCAQDVVCLLAIWKWLEPLLKESDELPLQVEHQTAFICHDIQENGFAFNKNKATFLLRKVQSEMAELEDNMRREWPAELVEDRRIQWREKKDGTPYSTCVKAMADAPKWEKDGDELVLYKWKEFNPASPIDRIDKLWDAGWKPFDRTKGHIAFEREKRSWK